MSEGVTKSMGGGGEPTRPTSPAGGVPPPAHTAAVPARIGHYAILRVLGEGGMGTVYEAQQESPKRAVALKVIRAGYLAPALLRRFELESQVLGRLQHPGIAQVYEAGVVKDGRGGDLPFFAMEFVKGVPLTDYAAQKCLGTRERLELLARVCDAVYHAHQKGIIHRDLKPANIMVDESGQPKILDFGVARATDSDLQQTTMQTDVGAIIGTVPYMSPEQVGGDPDDLDTRSDVYALGVIAYELLAGRLPYDLQRKMIHEAARIIREEEPTRLSSINRTLRGDVETIVAKALEKDKARRYQSAETFASDIRRYLKHETITARPASTWYQLQKFSRRNRGLVAGVAATMLAMAGGLLATAVALKRARAAESAEKERADELTEVSEFQASQLSDIDPRVMGERLVKHLAAEINAGLERDGAGADEVRDALDRFSGSLAHANLTNVALASLDETIFERAIRTVDDRFAGQPLVKATLLLSVANTMVKLGLQDKAEAPLREVIAIRKRLLGENDPDYLSSVHALGMLLMSQGRLADAESCLRTALEGKRRELGVDHVSTLVTLNTLGRLLRDRGDFADAEASIREAFERRGRTLGSDDPDTLRSMISLADLLVVRDRPGDAETVCREAVERCRRILGNLDTDTLQSINCLGLALLDQGRPSEAEHLWREALDGRRRVLGDDHPDTLVSLNNLGFVLRAQGRHAEAEPLFREALERKRRVLGGSHPSTLASLNNMGLLMRSLGRHAEAESLFSACLEKRRRVLGDDHPDTLRTMMNFGASLRDQGKPEVGLPALKEGLDRSERALGGEHPLTLELFFSVPDCLIRLGKFGESEALALECERRNRVRYGDEHAETRDAVGLLVRVYSGWDAAEPGKGYDAKAAEWKARLDALNAEQAKPDEQVPTADQDPPAAPATSSEPR